MTAKPLNYTTTIDATKSVGEVMGVLAAHGATAITTTYDGGHPTGIGFTLTTPFGPRTFHLPVEAERMRRALVRARNDGTIRVPEKATGLDQARRVGWRVVKDWLEAQLALVAVDLATVDQVLLPYLQDGDGRSLYARYVESEQLALEAAP